MSYQDHLNDIERLNAEDLYSESSRQYFIETMHGVYPVGAYGYIAGFDSLDAAIERFKYLAKTNCGDIRLVDKRRKLVELPV